MLTGVISETKFIRERLENLGTCRPWNVGCCSLRFSALCSWAALWVQAIEENSKLRTIMLILKMNK